MPDVAGELTTILREEFDVEEIELGRTLDDMGVDSVGTIELIDIIKGKFGIAMDDEELTTKNTVSQVISAVTAKVDA
ncbi:acyl carrier protein [Sciscionella sediminilitoris]|uniref:acyl carrier protein n=1 Tax=Sciscionella sediminilitoris TaxID=1445613 RepID=UPI0004DEDF2C|nr:acyl carrier protein [Sciscionella sp. SE31]